MPTYEYRCTSCGNVIEVFQRIGDEPLTVCEVCGGPLRKVFHPAGIVFKGSGFYATDSRSARKGDGKTDEGKAAQSSGSGSDKGGAEKGGSEKGGSDKGGSEKGGSGGGSSEKPSAGSETSSTSSGSGTTS